MIEKLILLIVGFCLSVKTTGESSEGNCKYYFDNGSFVDLSPLNNPEIPL